VAELENGKAAAAEPRIWLVIISTGFLVIILVLSTPLIIERFYGYPKPDGVGDFGGQFGAVNALFSGLAFVGVIAALILQKRELALQRQELEQTREELRGQKEQLAAQNRTFRQQTFENTFFQLLRLHNEIVDSLVSHPYGREAIRGRDRIASLCSDFLHKLDLVSTRATNDKEALEEIDAVYEKFYNEHRGHLSHYLRNLSALLEFVAHSSIEKPGLYANIVRAQLSSSEILLLFYTGLSTLGYSKLKPLIERFSLLEGLNKTAVVDPAHLELYTPQGYGQPSSGSR
jgi:Putative phage abortive infection protein